MFTNRFSGFEMHFKNGGFLQLAMKPQESILSSIIVMTNYNR